MGEKLDKSSAKVAIIDDSRVVRMLFSEWLGAAGGIEIVGAFADGADALRSLAARPADIVVLDLMMPGIGGLDMLPLLAEVVPNARILVVSTASQAGSDMALRCLMRGAVHYLAKPTALSGEGSAAFRLALVDTVRTLHAAA